MHILETSLTQVGPHPTDQETHLTSLFLDTSSYLWLLSLLLAQT